MTLEDTIAETLRELAEDAPDAGPVFSTIQNRVRAEPQHVQRRRSGSAVLVAAVVASIAVAVAVVVNRDSNQAPPASTRPSPAAIHGVATATPPGQLIPESERRQAVPFRLPLLDGSGTFDLATHRGRVVVITWSASWCEPCRRRSSQVSDLSSLGSAGVDAVTIDHLDDRTAARRFFASQKISSSIVFDGRGSALRNLLDPASGQDRPVLPEGLPLTVVLDREHRVAAVYPVIGEPDTLLHAVERLAG